ncbi:MAG: APC family permease, partial [Thaumarchaeota archaeon]|nr:APC family permease [Nitrososphaerota archaeon]
MKENLISVKAATAVGLGAIIGAGIFTLSGTAIALAGSLTLVAFLLVGVVAIIVALEMGELCSIFPKQNGASYSFVYETFGSELGFITGILLYFSFASSISVVALGFGSYLTSLLGLSVTADSSYFAIALILILTLVNLGGITKAAKADLVLVIFKLLILFGVVIFALLYFAHNGSATNIFSSGSRNLGISGIFSASVAVFFAYSGFQSISTFASDVKGGPKGAGRAILYSVAISMIVYVLITVSLLVLVPANQFRIDADPLSFALKTAHAPGYFVSLVDIGALVATTSASLALLLSSSRILFQISSD